MKKPLIAACLLVLVQAHSAFAQQDGKSMVSEAMCYACHQLEAASLGPPWRAIAARHAGRKEVMVDALASKIVHGGGGAWGVVPMVPNQRVSIEQAKVMAAWILEQVPPKQ